MRTKPPLLKFGIFELDVATGELRKDGQLIHLRLQPVNVLRILLERAGDLVTRREITTALWPDDLDVDVEQGLNHCMKEIRSALGDRPEAPRFVQTLPRRGYRFLLEVQNIRLTNVASPSPVVPASDGHPVDRGPDQRADTNAAPSAPTLTEGNDLRVRILVTRIADGAVVWNESVDGRGTQPAALERSVVEVINERLRGAVESSRRYDRDAEPPKRDRRFE